MKPSAILKRAALWLIPISAGMFAWSAAMQDDLMAMVFLLAFIGTLALPWVIRAQLRDERTLEAERHLPEAERNKRGWENPCP